MRLSMAEARGSRTRQLRRAIADVILRGSGAGGLCPAPGAASPDAPASPSEAAPLPVVTTQASNPVGRTLARGPLPMPFRLLIAKVAAPAAPASLATVPEAAACMNYFDNSGDDMAGFREIPACGGANGEADHDADDWMPRNRGRKDRHAAGERIKARSMAGRQRRERISEGLQKLRLVVRGHGDTATMLDKAVACVDALQRRVTALETALLLHQACASLSPVLSRLEERKENVGKLRKLRFEAENKYDATHAMGEKMKEKMAECEETTAKNAAEREKEKSQLMAQVHELENKVHELENKVKELQAKLGISEESITRDDTSSDGNTSDN
ncbi:unnamed protein product [Closterium sp. Naga37s-1]|nr:unnamed protein product [Closterium sp. Naga37s-1]